MRAPAAAAAAAAAARRISALTSRRERYILDLRCCLLSFLSCV
jgi:hypothetical protein